MPQVGDQVVYLQQGHKLYYDRLRDKRRGPWDTIVSTAVYPEPHGVASTIDHKWLCIVYQAWMDANAELRLLTPSFCPLC